MEKKDRLFTMQVNDAFYDKLRQAAFDRRMSMARFIRVVVECVLSGDPENESKN